MIPSYSSKAVLTKKKRVFVPLRELLLPVQNFIGANRR